MIKRIFACTTDRRGVAALEFAIIAPVLIALVAAAVDIGTAVDRAIRLENAARTAAQHITRLPTDVSGAQAAARATLGSGTTATIDVRPAVCQCPPSGAAVGGSTMDCSGACATGMIVSVTVSATQPFTPIFHTNAMIPFNNLGASRSDVVVRLQ